MTREVRKIMLERKDRIAHMLAEGSCLVAGFDGTLYGEGVGRYREIVDFLEMQYEDMKGET